MPHVQISLGDRSLSAGMRPEKLQQLNSRMDMLCPPPTGGQVTAMQTNDAAPRRRIRSTMTANSGALCTCIEHTSLSHVLRIQSLKCTAV
jgi:hypothetical protein